MKKIVSLIIALILVFSVFAVSAVAFADTSSTTGDATQGGVELLADEAEDGADDDVKECEWKDYIGNHEGKNNKEGDDALYRAEITADGVVIKIDDVEATVEIVEFTKSAGFKLTINGENYVLYKETDGLHLYTPEDTQHWILLKEIEEPHAEIIFHEEIFNNLPQIIANKKLQGMSKEFKLDHEWLKDTELVESIFENIIYKLNTASSTEYAVESDSDRIYWEACSPSKEYKDIWTRYALTATASVQSTGWWGFRYVVMDKHGSSNTPVSTATDPKTGNENVLFRTEPFYIYIADTAAPEITKLHSDMIKIMEDGVKVGSTYTIKTNISISDTSSTTTTYQVFKKINGVWDMDKPIYDSSTKEVREGFEDCISTSGVITMLASDVRENNEPVYKIIYTVRDAQGYVTSTLGNDELEFTLFAVKETKKLTANEIWQIVLYIIAGLAAIGIVVVLCIKPKEPVPEGRTTPTAKTSTKEPSKKVKENKAEEVAPAVEVAEESADEGADATIEEEPTEEVEEVAAEEPETAAEEVTESASEEDKPHDDASGDAE